MSQAGADTGIAAGRDETGSAMIAILNRSTLVPDADVAAMTGAIAAQVHRDAAPLWDRVPAAVVFYSDPALVPTWANVIAIVDTVQEPPLGGREGFHSEEPPGPSTGSLPPWWRKKGEDEGGHTSSSNPGQRDPVAVAVAPALGNGAGVTVGDWSISTILSQEVLAMFIDPYCYLWAGDRKGGVFSLEICDPVEGTSYEVDGVSVSNFVTAPWFDSRAPLTAQFDMLGTLSTPLSILKGGSIVFVSAGKVHHAFGKEYPQWRREMKVGRFTRTSRRLGEARVIAQSE